MDVKMINLEQKISVKTEYILKILLDVWECVSSLVTVTKNQTHSDFQSLAFVNKIFEWLVKLFSFFLNVWPPYTLNTSYYLRWHYPFGRSEVCMYKKRQKSLLKVGHRTGEKFIKPFNWKYSYLCIYLSLYIYVSLHKW